MADICNPEKPGAIIDNKINSSFERQRPIDERNRFRVLLVISLSN